MLLLVNAHLSLFKPTHVLFNGDLSLKAILIMPSLRDVYRVVIAHAAEQLPFGPFAGGISASVFSTGHQFLHEVDATWTVSEAIKDYAREYGRLQIIFLVHHPWTYLDKRTTAYPQRN